MYRVIKFFTDLHDGNQPYNVGDTFPRKGIQVTEERLQELVRSDNKQGVPLIELVEEMPTEEVPVKPAAKKAPERKTTAKNAPDK